MAALLGIATLSACGSDTDEQPTTNATFEAPTPGSAKDQASPTKGSSANSTPIGGADSGGGAADPGAGTGGGSNPGSGGDPGAGGGSGNGGNGGSGDAPGDGTGGVDEGDGSGGGGDDGPGGEGGLSPEDLWHMPAADADPYLSNHIWDDQPGYQFVSPTGVYCELFPHAEQMVDGPSVICSEANGTESNAVTLKENGQPERILANRPLTPMDGTQTLPAGSRLEAGMVTCAVLTSGDTVQCAVGNTTFTTKG